LPRADGMLKPGSGKKAPENGNRTMQTGFLIALSLALMVYLMVRLVLWARRRSRGAVVAGALLSMFAPDPTLEANIRLAEEAKQQQVEEEEEGEPQ